MEREIGWGLDRNPDCGAERGLTDAGCWDDSRNQRDITNVTRSITQTAEDVKLRSSPTPQRTRLMTVSRRLGTSLALSGSLGDVV
jgi:hypothetical protein